MVVKDNEEYSIIYFEGDINSYTVNKFKDDIEKVYTLDKDIILNLNKVAYINSLGLGTIVELYKKQKQNTHLLKIVCKSPMIREVFEIVKFDKIIPIYNSDEEAV